MKVNSFCFCVFVLLIVGCATNTYNTPFVNTDETIQLTAGMSKSQVLEIMGEPLYVEYGDANSGFIYWVYEVRTQYVASELLVSGQIEPNKTHKSKKATKPIHRLRVDFKDDFLVKWSQIPSPMATPVEEKDNNKSKSRNSFFFEPKISRYSLDYYRTLAAEYDNGYYTPYGESCSTSSWDWDYHSQCSYRSILISEEVNQKLSRNSFLFGIHSGISFGKNKIGLDFEWDFDESFLLMLRYGRRIDFFGLDVHAAGGIWSYDLPYNSLAYQSNYTNYYDYENDDGFALAKVGINKEISLTGLKISPGFNVLIGDDLYTNFSLQVKVK